MIFWIAVIGLLLLALIILLPPVLRNQPLEPADDRQQQNIDIARDRKAALDTQLAEGELEQTEYDDAMLDLQTALAIDLEKLESIQLQQKGKWAVWALAATLPLLSLALYFQYGEYSVIQNPTLAEVPAAEQARDRLADLSIDEMQAIIEQRLREKPDDAQGWFMLGKTLMAQSQFEQAVAAYRQTLELVGEEPGVLFSLADALAMQNDGDMQGEPDRLVNRGLAISPRDPTGLWLAGLSAEQRLDYADAHSKWTLLLSLIENDPASSAEVSQLIQALEAQNPQLAASAPTVQVLTLSVSLSNDLSRLASPEDPVFVYARAMEGPPMPLAVKRLSVQDLPAEVVLSDSDAMIPDMTLSNFARVIVGARVSKSGNPIAQSGDLFVEVEGIDSNNPPENTVLSIDRVK